MLVAFLGLTRACGVGPLPTAGPGLRLSPLEEQRPEEELLESQGLLLLTRFLSAGAWPGSEWELKKKSLLDGWADYPPPLP